ncbi:hypothetical protein LTS09_017936 [Friedmanniomyces endolithicus]|nr:hypothetical protein LTS09_017936 [Friedmanniomyces endolithicus]
MAEQNPVQASGTGTHHGRHGYHYQDGLQTLNEHFLEACIISLSFENHPGVEQDRVDAFRDEIANYKDKVTSSAADYAAVMSTIAEAFAKIFTMRSVWAPFMSHLSESPGKREVAHNWGRDVA